jgi:hypothetical protein
MTLDLFQGIINFIALAKGDSFVVLISGNEAIFSWNIDKEGVLENKGSVRRQLL